MFFIVMIVNGVLCFFVLFYINFMFLVIFGILYIVFGGVYFCFINVLVVDFIGLNNIQYGVVIVLVIKDVLIVIMLVFVGK